MARAATTTDAFNAIAEPRRRQILDLLAAGERPVNDLVRLLGMAQPQVSKHLRVLREVGAVEVRDEGRQRVYRLNGAALKPIHDWVAAYEQTWSERFMQLDELLEELTSEEENDARQHSERGQNSDSDAPERHPDPDHPGVQRTEAPGLPGLDDA
jgi:DNA-binding transcriptional ArsR family regulator